MSAQIVVDISSDEDNAPKSSTKARSTGKQPSDPTKTAVKPPSRTSPTTDKSTLSAPVTANRPKDPSNIDPRSQSTNPSPPQTEPEAPPNRAVSAPQTAAAAATASPSSHPTTPATGPDPPKPTPLDINEFRHLVSAGSVPVKDSPLILSIQPASNNNNNKRKATDTLLEDQHPSARPRLPSPRLPTPTPTPYTGTSEHPVPPKSNNLLWSVPAWKPPEPTQSKGATEALERPSIPNIHVPVFAPKPAPKPKPPRQQRESKWTGAQLANLASALEAAFFHTTAAAADAFAGANGKTAKQVRETFSFLVNKRIFEFSDEAAEGNEGMGRGRGRGRGKGKVARRFERELRADRKQAAKTMKRVHRKEASENHWASVGMPETETAKTGTGTETGRRGRGTERGGRGGRRMRKKGEGVLDAAVGVGVVGDGDGGGGGR